MNHQRNNGGSAVCGSEGRLMRKRDLVDCPDCLALPMPVMGRPAREATASRNLTIRIADDERQRWTAEAGARSLADWIRETCNRASRERKVY